MGTNLLLNFHFASTEAEDVKPGMGSVKFVFDTPFLFLPGWTLPTLEWVFGGVGLECVIIYPSSHNWWEMHVFSCILAHDVNHVGLGNKEPAPLTAWQTLGSIIHLILLGNLSSHRGLVGMGFVRCLSL